MIDAVGQNDERKIIMMVFEAACCIRDRLKSIAPHYKKLRVVVISHPGNVGAEYGVVSGGNQEMVQADLSYGGIKKCKRGIFKRTGTLLAQTNDASIRLCEQRYSVVQVCMDLAKEEGFSLYNDTGAKVVELDFKSTSLPMIIDTDPKTRSDYIKKQGKFFKRLKTTFKVLVILTCIATVITVPIVLTYRYFMQYETGVVTWVDKDNGRFMMKSDKGNKVYDIRTKEMFVSSKSQSGLMSAIDVGAKVKMYLHNDQHHGINISEDGFVNINTDQIVVIQRSADNVPTVIKENGSNTQTVITVHQ